MRRGDALRRVRRAGARLLPAAAPGNIWVDLSPRPHQARTLIAPDLHRLRSDLLETVLRTIAPAAPVLAPPVPRMPWRLMVREQDAPEVLRALRSLPPHWEIRPDRDGRRIDVRPRYAVAGRALETGPDLALRIDVLRDAGGEHRGDSVGTLGRIGSAAWEETARQSLTVSHRRPGPPAPDMPIDVVYTWVDDRDPDWRARRDAALAAAPPGGSASRHPSATGQGRFADTEELRFSLRSLHRCANWVRRIHLVTDGQVPAWLRRDDPRLSVVSHEELLGGSRFNSHAIEAALHRIPGLAEHYLYLNDDVFFGRIAHPGDFFAAEGVARFFPSDLPIDPGPADPADPPIMSAAKNGRDLLRDRFGIEVRTKLRHTVHPQLRSVAAQIEAENPEQIARTRAALFRSPEDLSVASSLHHWYACAQGRSVPSTPNYLYLDLAAPHAPQALDALDSLRRYDTFCLNTEEGPLAPDRRAELTRFLEAYFPDPSPWELTSSRPTRRGPAPPASPPPPDSVP